MPSPSERLCELGALLGEVSDILGERGEGPVPPSWCERRGWTEFLLALDDGALARLEHGETAAQIAAMTSAPSSMRALAAQLSALTALPRPAIDVEAAPLRRASERKREQVAALAALVRAWAPRARRIVDLGAGHGHLTRELARALALEALGVEQRAHVVANARALTEDDAVRFVEADALGAPLALGGDDLVVGLHACGALGDHLVRAAAEAGAGVLLVSCCPQKIASLTREPLSQVARELGLAFAREHLGLANLATLAQGGKDSADVMERRHRRYALWLLLREAGVALPFGDEVDGIHRRQLRHPLETLAPRVFQARGLPAPPPLAIEEARARAAREHGRLRRLALPRTMLARALELALVLDRAALLEEAGGEAPEVIEAFDRSASPRNLAVVRAPGVQPALR